MSADAWQAVARECPCRIMAELHRSGAYHHGTAGRYPGKVLCSPRGTPLPDGWQPTAAQRRASGAGGAGAPAVPAGPAADQPARTPTGI